MSNDAKNSWLQKAKGEGAQVLRRHVTQSPGSVILEIAEKIRPWLTKMFEGVRDDNGMIMQPARIRAIALNVAQDVVRAQNRETASA